MLDPGALPAALDYLSAAPDVGVVGGNLRHGPRRPAIAGGQLPTPWRLYYQYSGLRRLWPNPARAPALRTYRILLATLRAKQALLAGLRRPGLRDAHAPLVAGLARARVFVMSPALASGTSPGPG